MKSKNITVTDARLLKALAGADAAQSSARGKKQDVEDVLYTGRLKKYYYEWDRLEVETKNGSELVRMTHPVTGSCFLDFTPFGERLFDKIRKRTYFAPLEEIICIIITIDNVDWCIGFSQDNVNKPAQIGGGALILGGYNNYVTVSGGKGVTFNTDQVVFKDWTNPGQWNEIPTADITHNNMISEDYYSKEDVDEMFKKLREELGLPVEEEDDDS